MVMSYAVGMGDVVLRERLPSLWRRIEDAHYSYLETDDSPEKLLQKKKLEGYIIEYLSIVPHECKFGLAETTKVFQRTLNELPEFSAYRAGIGWAALARYAGNLLAQPWRKEYRVIRLYSGFYKHEVESNIVGAETLLQAMGYRSEGRAGRLSLEMPICPDLVAAVSRDALIAHCECQIMSQVWEAVVGQGVRATWSDVAHERAAHAGSVQAAVARLVGYNDESEIYSNVPVTISAEIHHSRLADTRYHNNTMAQCNHVCAETPLEEPIAPIIHPSYMLHSNMIPPHVMYPIPHQHMNSDIPITVTQCNPVPMMASYAPVPYYYPVQAPYMMPTAVYAPIKHATNIPLNGYPPIHPYRYPAVPTAQLIELDSPSIYENGKFERHRDEERALRKINRAQESTKRTSMKSGFSDVSLHSLPRSDTQPTLSKAKEDGMGTYESWDYVFRNLSSKDQEVDSRSGFSQSLDRDSRTLDRLDREERRLKYQPTTMDLEDGLQALNLDRSYDEEMYRTAKVNENLMRLKQEQELKKAKHLAKKQSAEDKKTKRPPTEPVGNPKADALIPTKVPSDKVKLLTKKDVKDRKEVIKQQSLSNGALSNTAEVKKVKKPTKLVAVEAEKPSKSRPLENGVHKPAHTSKSAASSYDMKAQLVVSLDETDYTRRSPQKQTQLNGERERSLSRASSHHNSERERSDTGDGEAKRDKWQCGTCTYLNKGHIQACEMCGKSKRGPEIQPLTSGGRECPACTLVNNREARVCDACGTSLDHCPTYI